MNPTPDELHALDTAAASIFAGAVLEATRNGKRASTEQALFLGEAAYESSFALVLARRKLVTERKKEPPTPPSPAPS